MIHRLTLLCQSLWDLLSEASGYTEEQLEARLQYLDNTDGTADRRRRVGPSSCRCGAQVNPRAKVCLYCGADAPPRSAFDLI